MSNKMGLRSPKDIESLGRYLDSMIQELKSFVDACLLKPVPRVDLVQ